MSGEENICSLFLEHETIPVDFSPAVCLTFPSLSHYFSFFRIVYYPPQALSVSFITFSV
jgi:hypothetical protein